jgi:prepilin-type N-terminal cleavage/methylation domain-containing protein
MNLFFSRPGIRSGFTLVEMMVAMMVFLVLAGLVMQMVFTATQITQSQRQQMDSMTEARQSLDRIKLDWNYRIRRGDVAANFIKQDGNDQIQLLSQASSYGGSRKLLSGVSYRIREQRAGAGNPVFVMERGVVGFNWQSAVTGTNSFAMPAFADNTYELFAKSVFRLEFCFIKKIRNPGDSPYTANISDVRESNPQPAYTDNASLNLTSPNFAGFVVAVAVLDEKGRQIVSDDQLRQLAQDLPDVLDGETPLSQWTPLINSPTFAAGIPRSVAGSVRVYQRVFYVNE